MSVELYWDNDEQTVMLLEFEGQWTWDELFEKLDVARKAGERADYEISAIVNAASGVHFPGGSLFKPVNLENAKKMLKMGAAGTGPVVIAGANPFIKTIYDTMSSLHKHATSKIYFAADVDEARLLLAERQPA